MPDIINETLCPLCGSPNNCMAHREESCWCNGVTFPADLLALVPVPKQRKACICLSCLQAFTANPQKFTSRFGG
jgi:Cysteine-rich CWC